MKNNGTIKLIFADYDEYLHLISDDVSYSTKWFEDNLLDHLKNVLKNGIGNVDFIDMLINSTSFGSFLGKRVYKKGYIHINFLRNGFREDYYINDNYAYIKLNDKSWFEITSDIKAIGEFIMILHQFLIEPKCVCYKYDPVNMFSKIVSIDRYIKK